jgi:hypothetical protein
VIAWALKKHEDVEPVALVGLWEASLRSKAIKATSFFWFVFSATGKNEQCQKYK